MSGVNSRTGDLSIRQRYPHPIASAWHRVSLATNHAARVQQAVQALDITLRVTAMLLVADYLRGPPVEPVEELLARLDRPSLGVWLGLARESLRALRDRDEEPFAPEAVPAWFTAKGKPTRALKNADALVALRNRIQHDGTAGGAAADAENAEKLVHGMRELLGSLEWLTAYRLARVVDQRPTRKRTTKGRVQFFDGATGLNEPVVAEWTAQLLPEAVYLVAPRGEAVLEVSPMFAVAPDPNLQEDRLFLLRDLDRKGRMVLVSQDTGATVVRHPEGDDWPQPWPRWLAERADREPVQDNHDRLQTLASPVRLRHADGTVLADRYEVLDRLGEGGMSTVYRVLDRLADKEVELKVLRAELSHDPEFRTRFRREAETMGATHHPRVLSDVALGELDDGSLTLRMPLLPGGTLAERIAAGPVNDDQAVAWATDLLEALQHLEERGVVHRDVKPSNLLLDRDDRLVLGDFGIALSQTDQRLTRTLQQLGSLAYMAPEARTSADVGHAADRYSAAIVLHELATGALPQGLPGDDVAGPLGAVARSLGALDPEARTSLAHAQKLLAGEVDETDGAEVAELPDPMAPISPHPTDDHLVVLSALGFGLLLTLCMAGPGLAVIPAWHDDSWPVALPSAATWGFLAAGGLVCLAHGAFVGMRSRGAPLVPTVVSGALAGAFGFVHGGVPTYSARMASGLLGALKDGDQETAAALTQSLLDGMVSSLLGLPVSAGVAAATAVVGMRAVARLRAAPQPTTPDINLRVNAAIVGLSATSLTGLFVTAAVQHLLPPLAKNQGLAGETLQVTLNGAFQLSLALTVGASAVLYLDAYRHEARLQADSLAGWKHLIYLPFLALLALATFAMGPMTGGGMLVVTLGALVWDRLRDKRPEPPLVHRHPYSFVAGLSLAASVWLALTPTNQMLGLGLASSLSVAFIEPLRGLADAPWAWTFRTTARYLVLPLGAGAWSMGGMLLGYRPTAWFVGWWRPQSCRSELGRPWLFGLGLVLLGASIAIGTPTVVSMYEPHPLELTDETELDNAVRESWRQLLVETPDGGEKSAIKGATKHPTRARPVLLRAMSRALGSRRPGVALDPTQTVDDPDPFAVVRIDLDAVDDDGPAGQLLDGWRRGDDDAMAQAAALPEAGPVERAGAMLLGSRPLTTADLQALEADTSLLLWARMLEVFTAAGRIDAMTLREASRRFDTLSDEPDGGVALVAAHVAERKGAVDEARSWIDRALTPYRNRVDLRARRLAIAIRHGETEVERELTRELLEVDLDAMKRPEFVFVEVTTAYAGSGRVREALELLARTEPAEHVRARAQLAEHVASRLTSERRAAEVQQQWQDRIADLPDDGSAPSAAAPRQPSPCEQRYDDVGAELLATPELCDPTDLDRLFLALAHGEAALAAVTDAEAEPHLEALRALWPRPDADLPLRQRLRAARRDPWTP